MFPPDPLDTSVDRLLATTMMVLVWGFLLLALLRLLRRSRRDLSLELPLGVGYALRLLTIAAVSATGLGTALRGGDEVTFLYAAHAIAATPFGSNDWLPFGANGLHTILFALQLRLGEFTANTMRITQVGIAMVGVTLIVVTVHDLADQRAARLCAWLLALEPTSVFFSEVLHKEPNMVLASGLVAFGGAKTWQRLSPGGIALMGLGAVIAIATRPYAGWFLTAAGVLLLMHAALRQTRQLRGRSVLTLIGIALIVTIAAPTILQQSSNSHLQLLQTSQTANSSAAGTAGNNLALEQVDFSTRSGIVTNLPRRVLDLMLRPYPWQLGDTSQRFGALGTLVAYATLALLALYMVRLGWGSIASIAPLAYPLLMLTIAYALSVGNAGTGFRYRAHLVTLAIASLVVLRSKWMTAAARETARGPSSGRRAPWRPLVPSSIGTVSPASVRGRPQPRGWSS